MSVFEITIQRKDKDAWPVVVKHQPGAQELASWSRGRLNLDLAALDPLLPSQKAYGLFLGKALFQGEIQDAFVRALAKSTEEPLRVLLIVEADDLRRLHWERLCAPLDRGWDYLLLNQQTPFSLYLPSQIERRFPPIGRRDLRALVLVAGPEELDGDYGLASFDVAATVDSLRQALGRIPFEVLASVQGASGLPRLDALCEQITARADSEAYTLLHLVCHGAYHQATGETLLYFPSDEGRRLVPASTLIERLGRLRRLPHLTFLSTCESADPRAEAGLGGLAQRLVRELGMPAVVAMTDRASIATAQALAAAFYARLCEHGEVDRALGQALAGLQGRADVTVPALFSRLGGQTLWSDALDRPLTGAEVGAGLAQMGALLDERAPVLEADFEDLAVTLRASLDADPAALSAVARLERQAALAAANQLCSQALDLSFNALALGQTPPAYDGRCPFRGLFPFRTEDREFFFGRQALVDKLVGRLGEHGFLAVLGPSGSGKSSLVLAGVVPAIQQGNSSLRTAYLTPGSDPLAQLKAALTGAGEGDAGPDLVVVDQFEELFTLCRDAGARRAFVERLLALSDSSRIVITMRADFWGECAALPGLKDEMQDHQELVPAMDAAALRRAMECQADHVGLRFEAGLGEAILDDVEGEPGAMPLLQHALLLLWQRRHGRWLCWEEYRAIGGIRQAIAHTADKVYLGLAEHEQERMRDIFLRLTHLEDEPGGAEARDTRRRVNLAELVPAGREPTDTVALVKRLADARLVVTSLNAASGDEEVEVAHEALIRHWPRLRSWLDEDRAGLRLRENLREAALDWQANGQDEAYLVHRRGRLEDAEALRRQPRFALNELEQAYVEACVELQERQRREKEEQQRRELEAARKLAAEEQLRAVEGEKAARDLRRRLIAAVTIGVLAIAAAGAAVWFGLDASKQRDSTEIALVTATAAQGWAETEAQNAVKAEGTAVAERVRAETQATLALSRQLSAQAISFVGQQPDLSTLLSLEALNLMTDSEDRKELLVNLAYSPFLSRFLHGHTAPIYVVAYSPDGHTLASGDEEGNVMLWDLSTGHPLHPFLTGRKGYVSALAFSPDSQILASGIDTTVTLWDVASGEVLGPPLEGLARPVMSLAFSSDGGTLAVSSGSDLWLWNVAGGRPPDEPARQFRNPIRAFSPDDRTLALVIGHRVQIADMETGEALTERLEGHTNQIHGLTFSPDGRRLATASYDESVILWDVAGRLPAGGPNRDGSSADSATGESQEDLPHDVALLGHDGRVLAVAFSPDGQTLASGSTDSTIILWDVATGERIGHPLHGHNNWVRSLAFSPDGQTLASGDADGTVILWDMSVRRFLAGQTAEVRAVAFSPDGRTLASSSLDNTAILWDATTGKPLGPPLEGHTKDVLGVAFSPDSQILATFGQDARVLLWDVETRQQVRPALLGHDMAVIDGAFSPDGRLLASGDWAGTIIIWELPRHLTFDESSAVQPVSHRLTGHSDQVIGLAFSPDSHILASGSADGTIILWNVDSYQPLGPPLTGHQNWVTSVAFSPDGKTLVSSSSDKSIILWDVASGQRLRAPLTGHAAQVWKVVFDPTSNGQRLISGGGDGTILQWDVVTGEPKGPPILGDFEMEGGLAVHPGGQILATGNYGGSAVIVWQLDKADWLTRACSTADRNLTQAEWEEYIGLDRTYRCTCPNLPPGEGAPQDACEQSLPAAEQP